MSSSTHCFCWEVKKSYWGYLVSIYLFLFSCFKNVLFAFVFQHFCVCSWMNLFVIILLKIPWACQMCKVFPQIWKFFSHIIFSTTFFLSSPARIPMTWMSDFLLLSQKPLKFCSFFSLPFQSLLLSLHNFYWSSTSLILSSVIFILLLKPFGFSFFWWYWFFFISSIS